MKFYDFPQSGNSWKVRALVHLLQIPVEIIKMEGLKGATRNDTFKKKNVDQRLPLLEIDNQHFLSESGAIMVYLAQGTDLWSENPYEQAQILRWMFFEQNRIVPSIAVIRWILLYFPAENRNQAFLDGLVPRANQALQVMNDHLAKNDFFVGDRFTIADIALFAYSHVANEAGIDLSAYPNILTWIKKVEKRDRFIPFLER